MDSVRHARRWWCVGAVVVGLWAGPVTGDALGDDLVVETRSGSLRGVATGESREWRGIPYAAAPVGDLRWRPPRPAERWTGVRDASEFGPRCPQVGPDGVVGDEDCLHLNVFAPAAAAATDALPVMVHLHGGNNSVFWAYEDASAFVAHDVVVVTVEYRLGVLGFVGHPALSAEGGGSSGEYGLLDQIAALEWVRDEIAAFGGDPGNVTLFGESAGSFDATALVVSPRAQGLFQRAALQTESFWALHGLGAIDDAERYGSTVADTVGCARSPAMLECLRDTPADELVDALGFFDEAPWTGGVVLPEAPIRLMEQRPVTMPLIIGSNREEGAFFFGEVFEGTAYPTESFTRDTDEIAGPVNGATVRAMYPVSSYGSELWAAIAAFTDAIYTCPIRRLGLAAAGPVWRYLYTHRLENDDFLAGLRASHFLDEPILWGTSTLLDGFDRADYEFSDADRALSDAMVTYWTNFAKSGDPNGDDVRAWPVFTAETEQIQVLDDQITTIDHWRVEQCALFDTIPEPFPGR